MIIKFYSRENDILNPNIKLHTTKNYLLNFFPNSVSIQSIKSHFNIKTGNFTEYPNCTKETHTNFFYCWKESKALKRVEITENLEIDTSYNFYRFLDKENNKIIQFSKETIDKKLKEITSKKIIDLNVENAKILEYFNESLQIKTFNDNVIININDYDYFMIMMSSLD